MWNLPNISVVAIMKRNHQVDSLFTGCMSFDHLPFLMFWFNFDHLILSCGCSGDWSSDGTKEGEEGKKKHDHGQLHWQRKDRGVIASY